MLKGIARQRGLNPTCLTGSLSKCRTYAGGRCTSPTCLGRRQGAALEIPGAAPVPFNRLPSGRLSTRLHLPCVLKPAAC
jgi:hypothetical protein